ncbi:hypothetical protein [Mycobacterium sp. ITM-2016-00318]|uniref:hypothetical protein n=1 Tax=Mycobacterium sp. ITM-2016-00318 TaxID=2099693 RepID=UPI000CF9DF24|nr:hypothetical protein [Mycobacterium sp. ITM-2016-00318]WNG95177.1 hypothetical protein C6A82_012490 [Mycobacterium sp. ITM-2016-00318]
MAGVAVAGVSALAVSPVAPPMPDVKVPAISSAAAELTALANPIEEFATAFEQAFANADALREIIAANPAPILAAILTNQGSSLEVLAQVAQVVSDGLVTEFTNTVPGQLQSALDDITAGDVTDGLNNAFNAVLGAVVGAALPLAFGELGSQFAGIAQNPFENLSNVVNTVTNPQMVLGSVLAPLGLIQGTINVVGPTAEAFLGAAEDPEAFANAILTFAPALTDALLNGDLASPGLLTPFSGIVNNLLALRQAIANSIEPLVPAAAERTSLPAANETTIGAASTFDVSIEETESTPKPDAGVASKKDSGPTTAPQLGSHGAGETGTDSTKKRANPASDVRKGIEGAVKDVSKGLKNAAATLGGNSTDPAKSQNASDSKDSASGSTADNGPTSSNTE